MRFVVTTSWGYFHVLFYTKKYISNMPLMFFSKLLHILKRQLLTSSTWGWVLWSTLDKFAVKEAFTLEANNHSQQPHSHLTMPCLLFVAIKHSNCFYLLKQSHKQGIWGLLVTCNLHIQWMLRPKHHQSKANEAEVFSKAEIYRRTCQTMQRHIKQSASVAFFLSSRLLGWNTSSAPKDLWRWI